MFATLGAQAEEVRLRCTADTNLSSYEGEQDLNYGHSTRLRLKGIQMLALFQFDTAPLMGWQIQKATLYLRYAGNERKLRTVGISTVSSPWEEGTGAGEKKIYESCFRWSGQSKTPWAGPSTDFTDVSFTAGHTLANYADVKVLEDGWIAVPVQPRLVQALVAGVSYGLAVTDEKGQTGANNDIYSREQANSAPYLVIQGAPGRNTAPDTIERLTATSDSGHADFNFGAMQVSFIAPPDVFAYEVYYSPQGPAAPLSLPRFAIPFAEPGKKQTLRFTGLKPSSPVHVEIVPVSAAGVRGTATQVNGTSSSTRLRPPALLHPIPIIGSKEPPKLYSEALRLWAYPETEKADPVWGNLLEEVGEKRYNTTPLGDYRSSNSVWDGKTVRLYGARNEFVAFQLLIEAAKTSLKQVTLRAPETFQSADRTKTWKPRVGLFRDWYVKDGDWFPEVCVPLTAPFDIPTKDNFVPEQKNQSVYVELLIPADAPPGFYRSALTVSAAGVDPIRVPVEVMVSPLTLPDTLSFDLSLNTYGTLGGPFGLDDRTPAYRDLEREYHRLAHLHRATLVVLVYSHSGTVSTHYAPPLEGEGAKLHVKDWSDWDAQFGPYLDGSAFADLPRKGVPITHFYLPFHEAWPMDMHTHYHYQQTVADYPALITEHALQAPPVEQAFDKEFGLGFTAVARQFAEHLRAKGWTRTQFQLYQNDKHYYKDPKQGGKGTSWWLLDEPNHRDDWLALGYFDGFFRKGIQGVRGVTMLHREDISRPQWQRDYLDGHVDLMVVSDELYNKGPRLREMQETLGVRYWNYGAANPVRRSNTEAEIWALRAWLAGADGLVPWQSVGDDNNYTRAEETALILPGKRFGIVGPVASLRLKALRRAQQDAEYLTLFADRQLYSRAQVANALRDYITATGTFLQRNADALGSYSYGPLRAGDFAIIRRVIAETAAK